MNIYIGLIFSDFRLYYKIKSILENKYIFEHLLPNVVLTPYDLILTESKYSNQVNHPKVIIIYPNFSASKILSLIIKSINENLTYNLIIGVDPGKSIGVAILLDYKLINTNLFSDIKKMIIWIKNEIKLVKYDIFTIKIGDGNNPYFHNIKENIDLQFNKIATIKIVNEKNTSQKVQKSVSIHEQAAIRIAHRS